MTKSQLLVEMLLISHKKKKKPCTITRHMFPVLKGNTEAQIARNAAC